MDQRREQGGLEGIDPQQRSDEGRRIEGLDRPAISQDGHSGLTQRSKVIGPWCAGSGGTIPIANILLILGSTSSTAAAADLLARTSGRSRHDPVRRQEHPLEQRVLAGGPGTVTTIITTVLVVSAAHRSRRNNLLQTFQHPLVVGVDAVPIHLAEEGVDRGPQGRGGDGRVEGTAQRESRAVGGGGNDDAGIVGKERRAALGQHLGDAPILLLNGGGRRIAGLALLARLLHYLFILFLYWICLSSNRSGYRTPPKRSAALQPV